MKHISFLLISILIASFSLVSTNLHSQPCQPLPPFKGECPPPILICPNPCILKDGLYVGLEGGYQFFRFHQSDVFSNVNPFIPNFSEAADGGLVRVVAGFGQTYEWFYYAGELFFDYSWAEVNYSANIGIANYRAMFKANKSFGASLLPGIKLNNLVLFYLKVGYIRSLFVSDERLILPPFFSFSGSQWENGLQGGFGLEVLLDKNVSMRGEYLYTNYGNLESNSGSVFSLYNNQLTLGFIYHFDLI